MALPWPLLWLLDPAGAYWARRTPRPHGPVHRGAAVFGPGVPGGSRQATDEEIRAMTADRSGIAEHEAAIDETRDRWSTELRQAADELLRGSSVSLRLPGRSIDARIVRFWRGDHLLETRTTRPDEEGSSRTRISRRAGTDVLVEYLARAAAKV
jgi:hypothetical protein